MNKQSPHTFPLDRLMQDLSNQGFHITPDMYVRVQTILQQLGKEYYKPDEKDTYKKLAYIIAPIVVKNPQEQQKFDEVFKKYVEYLEQKATAFKSNEEEVSESSFDEQATPDIKEEWYRKPLIWLVVFGVLGLGILFFNYYKNLNKPIENTTQIDSTIDTSETIIDTTKIETPSISQPIDTLQSELQINVGAFDYTEFDGHTGGITDVEFSPDGKYIATASYDFTARLWNIDTDDNDELKGHQFTVSSIKFSPNGKKIATASFENTVIIWDVKTQNYKRYENHGGSISEIKFSPDGKHIATASFDRTAGILNVETGNYEGYIGHRRNVLDVEFSPDGKYIATASTDGTARVWNVEIPDYKEYNGHQSELTDIEFSPDGKYIATASKDGAIRVWNVETQDYKEYNGHQSPVWDVEFSPNGNYIATASQDHTARVWNLHSTNHLNTQPTQKAYLFPFLLFLLLTALATALFNHLNKTKTAPFNPNKNAQPPYKIPFPEQAVIPATPQVYQVAKMLRQRQAGWRYRVDIPATVRATIAKGGFPVIRHRGNTRLPEYLFLIDLETPDAQQVRWLEEVLALLRREEVLMACYYFKQDPSWCWNREQPDGLGIYELHRRFPDHRLVIYGDGDYWLDSFEARTDERVLRDFPLWSQRALLTTVPPENWSYRERLLQQYFNLIPGDMKEPLVLATALMTQPEAFEQIRQARSTGTDRFIEFNTLDDIRDFLTYDKHTTHTPLLDWLAATTVYPEPQWEITLAVGKALEQLPEYEGILTLPNLRRLTQIKWMNRDAFPENLRQDLLAHLHSRPQVATRARETVIGLLQEAQQDLPHDSYAHTDARIKIVEQQLKVAPVSRQIEDEAIELANQGLIHEDKTLRKKRFERKAATIAGVMLTAALSTLILCTATLQIFPQIKEQWDLVKTVSFDLPIRIDDINEQDSLGVKIVSENFQRAFNVMPNEEYLVRGIPIEFLGEKGEMEIVFEDYTIEVDSFVMNPTPMQKLTPQKKRIIPKPIQQLMDDMVLVKGGTFEMGCTSEQTNCDEDEKPVHTVTLDNFNIGKYEITQEQWQAVMGGNPSYFKDCGDQCPVEDVSWDDTQEFIKKLNRMIGKTFRLPTEAEWEFAARGGTKSKGFRYAGSDNIDEVAWNWDMETQLQTHTVGTKKSNELGLYDMSGNVWEWCNDWYDEDYYKNSPRNNPKGPGTSQTYRVLRGGSWSYNANYCRVADRFRYRPYNTDATVGFRLAQTP